MLFDPNRQYRQRIAVIGGGISGLASAYLLAQQNEVTLFEAAPKLGGHARTVMAGQHGNQPVDTGFIVFNYVTYPLLTRLFQDLDVPIAKSNMSFGVSVDNGHIEYALSSLNALMAQRRNLLRPGFARMVRDILRFNDKAATLSLDESTTIGEMVDELGLGKWFQRYYLMPFCGAIWSTSPSDIRNFPARALVQFLQNHALLSTSGQHQWWTVDGGSTEYVQRVERALQKRGVTVWTGTAVCSVERDGQQATIHSATAPAQTFDHVIFACHADMALKLLSRPTEQERKTLSAMKFQDNQMILHCDTGQMPVRKNAWSSWVYKADTTQPEPSIGVTYWMNRLQNIDENDPLFVSLNPSKPVPDHLIYDQTTFRHPVFDTAALIAQKQLKEMQGDNNTWYAGAYTRNGFHEDGFASAARIARLMERRVS